MLAFFVRFFVAYRSHCCPFFRPHPFPNLQLAGNNAHGDDSQLLGGVSTLLCVDCVAVTLHGT
jgi:hypothetical protein